MGSHWQAISLFPLCLCVLKILKHRGTEKTEGKVISARCKVKDVRRGWRTSRDDHRRSLLKKFQFRLQRLLWYHQQRQKQAEVQLQQAAMQREAAAAELRDVQEQLEAACQLPERAGQLVDLCARQNVVAHLQVLGRTVTAAQEKLKLAEQRVREADRVRTQITKDVEGLLHLRAVQQAEHHDEVAHQQQIVLDEVVMRQWSMRDADATASP